MPGKITAFETKTPGFLRYDPTFPVKIWKIQWRFANLSKPPTDKRSGSDYLCLVNCLCGAVNVYDPKMLKYLFWWRSMRSNFPKWPFYNLGPGEVLFLHRGSWKRVHPGLVSFRLGVVFHFHDQERKGIVTLPKFNMESENGSLEKENPFGNHHF